MTRAFFLFGAAVAALTLTSLRIASARRVPRHNAASEGRCADRRRRLRWPSPADFS